MTGGGAEAERRRLDDARSRQAPWKRWGPYLAERAWGTVREDYSADGDAWRSFPHEHARSRAYRWNEDGLCGLSDDHQFLCWALALWNGNDPFLKERAFGLTGHEGNHGEDAKDYWWFVDSTPSHSWMRWRYHYPLERFPYEDLVAENARRTRLDPEYELLDTAVFDAGWWQVDVSIAKADAEDLCIHVTAANRSTRVATLHLLPTLWWRNTWSWGRDDRKPWIRAAGDGALHAGGHTFLTDRVLAGDGTPTLLFCDNESNSARLWGAGDSPPYPKDGINDHVVAGAPTVNPAGQGTKAALWYRVDVEPGAAAEVRLRLAPATASSATATPATASPAPLNLGASWDDAMAVRAAEADEYFTDLIPPSLPPAEAAVVRQALAGMLWTKQYYHFNVDHWLDGDPGQPPPPVGHGHVRNERWRHLDNADVISMPDTWEYPWYAAWDLAFHCVALAHVDPDFAKEQLVLLGREWYMHPNGQLPAYEWDFGDVNPPVHAWAAIRVWEIDGRRDFDFLERVLHKLSLNFTWWVNRKDAEGNNVFEGGFLGLDNIGPFDRSEVPVAGHLEQSDGTAWMAFFALSLLGLSLILAVHDHTYEDLATKFFEHFTLIAAAMDEQGLWDDDDGFYYDVLHQPDGNRIPLRARSMVGLVPLFAVALLEGDDLARIPDFRFRMDWFLANRPRLAGAGVHVVPDGPNDHRLLSVVSPDRLRRVLARMLGEDEFLSPFGLRALSRYHRDHPLQLDVDGVIASVGYEPGESTTGLFGGNSNWRGPVWFPVNHLVITALRRYHHFLGAAFTVEHPSGSGQLRDLGEVADDLAARLVSLFVAPDGGGTPPSLAGLPRPATGGAWTELLCFHEYFHGESGLGLGASHQTGWTGLVADLLLGCPRGRAATTPGHRLDAT